jgi:2-dehydro-3-deoxyglucarate aldolase/4-hydroxy-2-oxoheptanedioate aldolase
MMKQPSAFPDKLKAGKLCLGTCITFSDPTVTEALTGVLDFVWIDMEHNPQSLEAVQAHIMATKGTDTTPLVRVPWNNPVLIKPVLDIGAAGVIVPLIRTADDARRAVAACLYPPEGVRGYGPRRPSDYGRSGGPAYCQAANESVITICQIEHTDAVANIDEILAVRGLTSVFIGPNDLAGSLGHIGEPRHPEVRAAIDVVLRAGEKASVPVGLAVGDDPTVLTEWVNKGARWLAIGADFILLLHSATYLTGLVRENERHARGEA